MSNLKLPRLIGDHMILQRNKKCHIWGFTDPKEKVEVSFLNESYSTEADDQGRFDLFMKEANAGGPYTLSVSTTTEKKELTDVYVGEVWHCSGQSNMELHMDRVADRFPEEIANCDYPLVRTFKITEHGEFHGPIEEHLSGEWKTACPDHIMAFSATGYFFAKALHMKTGVAVGFMDATLGGTLAQTWMSSEMLEGYDEELNLAKKYSDDDFLKGQLEMNMRNMYDWHKYLDANDMGLKESWEKEGISEGDWRNADIPFYFADSELKGFIGSVWFRKTVEIPASMAGKRAKIWLGTITDSDVVFVNGKKVGQTEYQYPPRKYTIPEGLLKEGANTIAIRVRVENGEGRFTWGKQYALFNKNTPEDSDWILDISGTWKYKIGTTCSQIKPTDFVNWKPTVLYNGMTAPCHNYTIGGIAWYQGEANIHEPGSYGDLLKRMFMGYRRAWKDMSIPVLMVELPNLTLDLDTKIGKGWEMVREFQRKAALEIPDAYSVVTMDVGEDNDWHPLNKKAVGERLALAAVHHNFNSDEEYTGPEVCDILTNVENGMVNMELTLSHAKGLSAVANEKSDKVLDFVLLTGQGAEIPMECELRDEKIFLTAKLEKGKGVPEKLWYCYGRTYKGALLYNDSDLPMSPFTMQVN